MNTLRRYEVIKKILEECKEDSAVFATTGETAREALKAGADSLLFFPCVGGMGHASSVAFGYGLQSQVRTICLDGDGSFLMHLGALSSITSSNGLNFLHFLFDNGCHLSVGGNKTSGLHLDYVALAKAFKYDEVIVLDNLDNIKNIFSLKHNLFPSIQFVYVPVYPIRESDLPRPRNLTSFVDRFRSNWQ